MVSRIIEITFTLILVYLILDNAKGFSSSVSAISGAYNSAVKTLQAR